VAKLNGSKPGGPFTRVDKSTYTLAEGSTAAAEKAVPRRRSRSRARAGARSKRPTA
jgi:hypothetical protein